MFPFAFKCQPVLETGLVKTILKHSTVNSVTNRRINELVLKSKGVLVKFVKVFDPYGPVFN